MRPCLREYGEAGSVHPHQLVPTRSTLPRGGNENLFDHMLHILAVAFWAALFFFFVFLDGQNLAEDVAAGLAFIFISWHGKNPLAVLLPTLRRCASEDFRIKLTVTSFGRGTNGPLPDRVSKDTPVDWRL